jgi:glycosyltransferase involved in cell wall biosynthesis
VNDQSVNDGPLVTAIVGCYNHGKYVHQALDSVRNQTYPNIQLIIFDDHSKDDSVDLIEEWIAQYRYPCLFLRHSENMGICRSFNDALGYAKGEYIAVLAADDAWLPHKTSVQIEQFARAAGNVAVVFSDALLMDSVGKLMEGTFIPRFRGEAGPISLENLFIDLWKRNYIPAMATLVRADYLRAVGKYDEDLIFEDWDLWLRLSHKFRFEFQPNPTAQYRILATSMSHSRNGEMLRSTVLMKAKLAAAGMLPPRLRKEGALLILEAVEQLYKEGGRDRYQMLRKSLKMHPTKRAAVMLLLTNCRVSYKTYSRVRSLWKKMSLRKVAT